MQNSQVDVILASGSPRRAELLRNIGLAFDIVPAAVDEGLPVGTNPATGVEQLAVRKARQVAALRPEAIVIGADTVVVCDGRILGKPADTGEAVRTLRLLSGKRHEVITGVAVICPRKTAGSGGPDSQLLVAHEVTAVYFRDITEAEIAAYVRSGEPMDKAGAYGIQGKAGIFVTRIEGCYFNVVGLPVPKLACLLGNCGVALL